MMMTQKKLKKEKRRKEARHLIASNKERKARDRWYVFPPPAVSKEQGRRVYEHKGSTRITALRSRTRTALRAHRINYYVVEDGDEAEDKDSGWCLSWPFELYTR